MSTENDREGREGGPGCVGLLGFWLAMEVGGWILIGLFGPGGSLWVLVGTLVVGVVFFMSFGVIRVLRGHEL